MNSIENKSTFNNKVNYVRGFERVGEDVETFAYVRLHTHEYSTELKRTEILSKNKTNCFASWQYEG